MSLWKIAWRSIQRRWLASALTMFSMALGVMLVVAVLLIHGIVAESFRTNASLGYNMIVGPPGGNLQLVLNSVYYLSTPVETLRYSYFKEFLGKEDRDDGKDGTYKPYVEWVIPICLGDYYREFRVVGTSTRMFDDYVYDLDRGRKYEFAQGRNFQYCSDEFGFFEAVVGASVARKYGLKVGDTLSPTHGAEGPEHDQFHIVGILRPSGTPADRAVFINIEGFYLLEGHTDSGEHRSLGEGTLREQSIPIAHEDRQVSALLVRTGVLVAAILRNQINESKAARAVMPIQEIYALFANIVTPVQRVLLLMTILICIVSGISILVSIYNSMSDRRQEIAIMRALGAGRSTVMYIVLLETIMLALGGGMAGWIGGHALIGLAAPQIEAQTGVRIGLFELAPAVKIFEFLNVDRIMNWGISSELLLIPALMALAVLVGFLPAVSAYRTDVARSLSP